jgi:hypothetical protein
MASWAGLPFNLYRGIEGSQIKEVYGSSFKRKVLINFSEFMS